MNPKIVFLLAVIFTPLFLFGQERNNWKYKPGISFGSELFYPNEKDPKSEFFYYSNLGGHSLNISFCNQLYFKKWFVSLDFEQSTTFQNQSIVFSNVQDPIISTKLKHTINHWLLSYGFNRKIDINKSNTLVIGVGFSTVGYYSTFWSPRSDVNGSFSSTSSQGTANLWDTITNIYDYEIRYRGRNFLSPYFNIGLSFPLKRGELIFKLTSRINRMNYWTDIVLRGETYTAIGITNYNAHAVGLSFTYLLNCKSRRE